MERLKERILTHAQRCPEGVPIAAKGLLHLGSRAAVDQALSRLAREGRLLRIGRGLYVRPIETKFGTRAPAVEKVVEAVAGLLGENVASSGAAAANALGLTTQVPVRTVYLTSGRSRKLCLGKQTVELKHAPRWQLALAHRPAGEAVRALVWLGPDKAKEASQKLRRTLPQGARKELASILHVLPTWLVQSIAELAEHD